MATAGHKGAPKTKVRRKEKKNVVAGQAHIKSTFNNTIIAITDPSGAVISWASAGTVGFKGSSFIHLIRTDSNVFFLMAE